LFYGLSQLSAALLLGYETGRAGPQIIGIVEEIAPGDSPLIRRQRLEILKLCEGVDVDLELSEVHDPAAPAAGAKSQNSGFVIELRSERGVLGHKNQYT